MSVPRVRVTGLYVLITKDEMRRELAGSKQDAARGQLGQTCQRTPSNHSPSTRRSII
ncbi:MAG TPA: hypothetical protein VN969_37865 [Streptosporangiaceae bacterium]|nr:hypothetical protein [Streptosporangiaceae bacterium]